MAKKEGLKKKKSWFRELVEIVAVAFLLAFTIKVFIFEFYKIPSGSMIPTLLVGDRIVVVKFIYGPRLPFINVRLPGLREPRIGDIVVFKAPPPNPPVSFIKRFIGREGDTIEIKNGKLVKGYLEKRSLNSIIEAIVSQYGNEKAKRFIDTLTRIAARNAPAISSATTASATTPHAGTAVTSALSTAAPAAFLVLMSTDFSGTLSVAIGFIKPFMMMSLPLVTPPSMPPALFVGLPKIFRPLSYVMRSWTSEPTRPAHSMPFPIETALTPWIDMTALASTPSIRLSHWI